MATNIKSPKQALNPAFLKLKSERREIELLKKEFIALLDRINPKEREEFHKNLTIEFLNSVYYKDKYYINTKGHVDLVIHNGNSSDSPVGVMIEVKSPVNKKEMVSRRNLNVKSFQELVLYQLRERKSGKNFELRYLIITNIYEWFVFDARTFEDTFAKVAKLVKLFDDFENKTSAATTTDKLNGYGGLNSLFFLVLSRTEDERRGELKTRFAYVPYLNSPLFEKTEIEDKIIFINNLQDDTKIKLYAKTVLCDAAVSDAYTCQIYFTVSARYPHSIGCRH